jgi:adenylate cyclase
MRRFIIREILKMIFRKRHLYALLILLIACTAAEFMAGREWFHPLDRLYYDAWHQLAGRRYEPAHVAIVAIDDESLRQNWDRPLAFWGPHFATAVEVLRDIGVRTIGIDFLFSVSAESWLKNLVTAESDLSRTYDISFRSRLGEGNVILIGMLSGDRKDSGEVLLPIPDFLFALPGGVADIGLANLILDSDEVVRQYTRALFEAPQLPRLTFGALLADRAVDDERADAATHCGTPPDENSARAIYYAGPPGTFPRISFMRLLAPDARTDPAVERLKGKVVIISAEYKENNDGHLTPYAPSLLKKRAIMSGGEIQANIVETLLGCRTLSPVAAYIRIGWLTGSVALGVFLFMRLKPLQAFGCMGILCLVCMGGAYLHFLQDRILAIAPIQVALVMGFIGSIGHRLTREEKARSYLQKALSPYVSDALTKKVLAGGRLPDLGGETLHVTVLFSDIRGFTSISEMLRPHELVEMLNQYYSQVCDPILAHGGMVDKFVGDAVMAVFGAPVAYPDQARRCVEAALSIVKIAERFQGWIEERFPGRNLPRFRIGIGIHSGEALVGNIGSPKRMGYTAIGDTVNIASRLEGMCKELGWTIVASIDTITSAGPGIETGRRSLVNPRGRVGEIEVLEVLGLTQEKEGEL